MSSLCLFKGNDIFSAAIAVAPVTNWKYYDSIYTERYMRTPKENKGYEENSPINHVEKLEGDFLMIHGTGDDNVHYQGSELLINELVKHNKSFDFMAYPNRSHSLKEGEGTQLHLHSLMTNYFEKYLKVD